MQANLYALGAIALWASLASLGVSLTHVPPFLLTGIALLIGSVPAWPLVLRDPSQWRIPLRTLALGVYGLFAYHFLLFIALRHAPPVEANLVNYLWPLFIVVLARLPSRGGARSAVRWPGATCLRWRRRSSGPAIRC
jgi:drug/metabolite transporter (DMT)-like permease